MARTSGTRAEHPAGCSKRPSSKAAADESTGGVASGYVEEAFEARTKLVDFFSILLRFDVSNDSGSPTQGLSRAAPPGGCGSGVRGLALSL